MTLSLKLHNGKHPCRYILVCGTSSIILLSCPSRRVLIRREINAESVLSRRSVARGILLANLNANVENLE